MSELETHSFLLGNPIVEYRYTIIYLKKNESFFDPAMIHMILLVHVRQYVDECITVGLVITILGESSTMQGLQMAGYPL